MVLDSACNDKAFLRSDVIHNKLLEHSSVNVVQVVLEAESRHTKGVIPVCSPEEELLVVGERVVMVQMVG